MRTKIEYSNDREVMEYNAGITFKGVSEDEGYQTTRKT